MNVRTLLSLSAPLFLLTASLLHPQGIKADTAAPPKLAATASATTTILPPQEAEVLFKFYFASDALFGKQDRHHRVKETYWTPTVTDVSQLETDLTTYLRTAAYADCLRQQGLEDCRHPIYVTSYFRQYAGVMQGGKKIILINGFIPPRASYFYPPPKPGSDQLFGYWRSRAVLVFDGGPSFFHAAYDTATRRVEGPAFNGRA